jgi:hypothetical protein
MQQMETWQAVLLGALAVGVVFLFRPGAKAALERSRQAKKDWPALLLPLAAVVAFVIFLIALV